MKPKTATRKDATKGKGLPQEVAAYWGSVGCTPRPYGKAFNNRLTTLPKMSEHLSAAIGMWGGPRLLEGGDSRAQQDKEGQGTRRSFDAEAKLALGSKARVYRAQNIYVFFGAGQKQVVLRRPLGPTRFPICST